MTSTPDKLKQEPPNDDTPMFDDGDTPRENGDSSGLSNQADGSQPGQSDMNQVGQNNGNQPGQNDKNQVIQSSDKQSGQNDINQTGQSNDNQAGQNDMNQVIQSSDNQAGQNDMNQTTQNNGEQPGQSGMNQTAQNNGNQSAQKDTNQIGQNNGERPSQRNINQATQNNENQPGQKDHVHQNQSNQSSNKVPFLSLFNKRKMDRDSSANNARAFSPAVEDPNAKKVRTDQSFTFDPSEKAKTAFISPQAQKAAPLSPRAQMTTRASPFPPGYGVDDIDLESDLVGSQVCPENMTTLGLVKEGKRPRYLNEYRISDPKGDRSILRIETLKDGKFDENAAEVLTSGKYQAQHADKKWREVDYVLGVAAFGSELKYQEFLCKLDPENPYKFKWRQTVLIGIRWTDRTVTFVSRQWWRDNYEARDPSARQTYLDRRENGYKYFYKTRDDPQVRSRENHNAFQDYRLFKWAFLYEKRYYQAMNPGQPFEIQDRVKSPSPIDDELAKFRAMTIEESPSSKIYQSVETPLPDPDEGFDTDSRRSTQSRYKSSGQPKEHRAASLRVDPNGSPRPRNKNTSNTMRRFQQPLGTTPHSMVVAH
ncbi:hypothetical protein IL306_001217 [Fusarium sp. DS 682]|nr:hypothetical protein IL306_001217 [Fusarium sp. DS 682]